MAGVNLITEDRDRLLRQYVSEGIQAAAAAEFAGYPPWDDEGRPLRSGIPDRTRYNEWNREYSALVQRMRESNG